jgi:hypothetical protein
MALFRQEAFFYTLNPPLLNEQAGLNSIDQFLFESRRGFCSHYASAFVYLMRAAGVPARVIGGYQGGEYKVEQNLIQVRQFDAHAWAEIWVQGRGWLRFDPTAAVSPQRIESGLEAALGATEAFLPDSPLSLYRYREVGFLNSVRLAFEQAEYQWQRSVVNYRQDQQEAFLRGLLGNKNFYWRQSMALSLGAVFIIGLLSFLLFYKKRTEKPLIILYRHFCKKMGRQGFQRQPGEAELSFAHRIAQARPEMADDVLFFTNQYLSAAYQESDQSLDKLKEVLLRF